MSDQDVARVVGAAESKLNDFLEVAGAMVENVAIQEALVDTGYYKGSMFHVVERMQAIIGANAEYSVYIEMKYKPVLRISLTQSINNLRRLFRATAI